MSYATSNEKLVYELKIEEEYESKYGYIAMTKDPHSNTISCAYAIHCMTLKLELRTVETREQKYLLYFIPIGEEITYDQERGNYLLLKNDINIAEWREIKKKFKLVIKTV